MKQLKLGIIGLDSSHASAFTHLLNDCNNEFHVPGGKVVIAHPGKASMDFDMSYKRLDGYTEEMRDKFDVNMVDSPEEVAEYSDAIFLESVDGRKRVDQFSKIIRYKKPVFVDKPFALSTKEAQQMLDLAVRYDVPVMSCSALRYAEALNLKLQDTKKGGIISADFYGPLPIQPTQPGLFWYGAHMVDMLFRTLGRGCKYVKAEKTDDHEVVIGVWSDGRIGTIRGNRCGNGVFGGTIHRTEGSDYVNVAADIKPYYASLLDVIMKMFTTGIPPMEKEDILEVMRFLEAGNESREKGCEVYL